MCCQGIKYSSLSLLSFLTSVHLIFRDNSSLLWELFAVFQSLNVLIFIQPCKALCHFILKSALYELPLFLLEHL